MATRKQISPDDDWKVGATYEIKCDVSSLAGGAAERATIDSCMDRFNDHNKKVLSYSYDGISRTLTVKVKAIDGGTPIHLILLYGAGGLIFIAAVYGLLLVIREVHEIIETGDIEIGPLKGNLIGVAIGVGGILLAISQIRSLNK